MFPPLEAAARDLAFALARTRAAALLLEHAAASGNGVYIIPAFRVYGLGLRNIGFGY